MIRLSKEELLLLDLQSDSEWADMKVQEEPDIDPTPEQLEIISKVIPLADMPIEKRLQLFSFAPDRETVLKYAASFIKISRNCMNELDYYGSVAFTRERTFPLDMSS